MNLPYALATLLAGAIALVLAYLAGRHAQARCDRLALGGMAEKIDALETDFNTLVLGPPPHIDIEEADCG
jgi:outer membrane murein-binding lipoprotein Lpp